jgi:Fe-S-cluster-containing hydrogenase component 2
VRIVRTLAVVDPELCTGCTICDRVCPTLAIVTDRKTHLAAVEDVRPEDKARIREICREAKFHPEQIICYCTATRADEAVAAILQGAHTPEEISVRTGIRTGCTVECQQPMLRLLHAAGLRPTPPKGGWQWYGKTVTAWEIPDEVKRKYSGRGFYFDADLEVFERVIDAPSQEE